MARIAWRITARCRIILLLTTGATIVYYMGFLSSNHNLGGVQLLNISSIHRAGVLPNLHSYWQCKPDEQIPTIFTTPSCLEEFLNQQKKQQQKTELPYLIPPIRHVMWKTEKISAYMTKHVMSWRKIHPNWKHVLWRDQDFEPFLQKFFPGNYYNLMQTLKKTSMIKLADLMRFAILLKYGGVYADLDFTLVNDIDEFRRLPAMVIREPELNSIGMHGSNQFPLKLLLMNSFMMSMPGHSFMDFCVTQSSFANPKVKIIDFAGPKALTRLAEKFISIYPVPHSPLQSVYIPPSYSFNSYPGNSIKYISKEQREMRLGGIQRFCNDKKQKRNAQIDQLCKDPMNLDPITDSSQKVFAMHDYNKSASVHSGRAMPEFDKDQKDIRDEFPEIKMASTLFELLPRTVQQFKGLLASR